MRGAGAGLLGSECGGCAMDCGSEVETKGGASLRAGEPMGLLLVAEGVACVWLEGEWGAVRLADNVLCVRGSGSLHWMDFSVREA